MRKETGIPGFSFSNTFRKSKEGNYSCWNLQNQNLSSILIVITVLLVTLLCSEFRSLCWAL